MIYLLDELSTHKSISNKFKSFITYKIHIFYYIYVLLELKFVDFIVTSLESH